MTVRVEIVDAEPPLIRIEDDGPRGTSSYLTKDEAVRLANQLTDAVDELEAVSGE